MASIAAEHEHDDTLRKVSKDLLDELLESQDASEGLAAFVEKRTPQWQGR
jgi:enoyl-CoA hydratase/carnithine racemase